MKKLLSNKLVIAIEVLVLTYLMYSSFTKGFTMSLSEAFGLGETAGFAEHLWGNSTQMMPWLAGLAIGLLLISAIVIYTRKKHIK